ncbi:hypothetical protein Z968_12280 [Clostridium novyi A str. 4552]|uniref:Uncharacterized protein n=1 Tax=Clostridium novyi A str. 4552 TaxID=1444289 RepID=A0A0A0I2S7_CLONO|nr:hypothetical protein [Clostridium novyi]KGM93985.1 hypothetical protein Z968_12280 [Clostridium novyi A str. 4552]
MLLYLSSNENIEIFDFLSKEKGMVIKKLSGEFYLKKFVIHDMRNLSHYAYFVIDLKALKDTENEIIEAIIAFKTMYDSRIIIFAEGMDRQDEIISKLIEEKIYNIVISKEIPEIKNEILKCISDEGRIEDEWIEQNDINQYLKESFKNQYVFKHKNIKIAVAGVSSRVGTTTTAFNIARFLFEIGAKVSYTEANSNEHLKEIAAYYEFLKVENYYKYRGIEYYPNKQFPNGYNFNVFDLGNLNKGSAAIFKSCDIKVLCSGSKPYELIDTYESTKFIQEDNYNILLSSISNEDNLKIRKSFDNVKANIYFGTYSPSLFDGKSNENIYRDIVKDYIVEI